MRITLRTIEGLDLITLAALVGLGGLIGVTGLRRALRLDRLRGQRMHQQACRWHRWVETNGDGAGIACALCGKRPSVMAEKDLEEGG